MTTPDYKKALQYAVEPDLLRETHWRHPVLLLGNVYCRWGDLTLAFPLSEYRPEDLVNSAENNQALQEFDPYRDIFPALQTMPFIHVDVMDALRRTNDRWALRKQFARIAECDAVHGPEFHDNGECDRCGGSGYLYKDLDMELPAPATYVLVGRDAYQAHALYRMLLIAQALNEPTVTLINCGYKAPCQFIVGRARVYIQAPPPNANIPNRGHGSWAMVRLN